MATIQLNFKSILLLLICILFVCCKTPNNINALSKKDKIKLESVFIDANKYKLTGDVDKAIEEFKKTNKIHPNGASYHELAKLYYEKRDFYEALKATDLAINLEPDNYWYYDYKVFLLIEKNDILQLSKVYIQIIKKFPDKSKLRKELAMCYSILKQNDKALKIYNEIEKENGFDKEISLLKEKIYAEDKKYDLLIKEIETRLQQDSSNIDDISKLARLYELIENPEKAIEIYNIFLSKKPKNPTLLLSIAEYYRKNNQLSKSFDYIRKAFQNPMTPKIRYEIILNYIVNDLAITKDEIIQNKWKNLIIELCDSTINLFPKSSDGYLLKGHYYTYINDNHSALQYYTHAIQYEKSNYNLWIEIILLSFELNKNQNIIKYTTEAIEIFPLQPTLYLYLAHAYLQEKDYKKAIENLKTGYSLVINNNELLLNFTTTLGDTYYKIGNTQESFKFYEKSLALNPDDPYVMNNYSYYLSLNNINIEKALKLSKKCVDLEPNSAIYIDTYAWALYKNKEYEKALIQIEKAIYLGGDKISEIVEHYGDILFKLNKIDDAVKKWKDSYYIEKKDTLLDKIQLKQIEK